jgi:hypothetical protein
MENSKNIIVTMLILIIIISVVTQTVIIMKIISKNPKRMCDIKSEVKSEQIEINQQPKIIQLDTPVISPQIIQPPPVDPLKMYDYQKLVDPLEEPTKRVDRYLLGPLHLRHMFNHPVRGYPDNPHWLGLLISTDDDQTNKIIKLFGRQKYPGSAQYDYYATINMGFDQIKVKIDRKKELYDDDIVEIGEINKTYKVKLNKNDDFSYNPYF